MVVIINVHYYNYIIYKVKQNFLQFTKQKNNCEKSTYYFQLYV